MGKKVLAKVVDHKDVSPSWKVLQMVCFLNQKSTPNSWRYNNIHCLQKLNEEKANSSQTVLVVSKKSAIKVYSSR